METITIGNRIPKGFFVTEGKGESDITVHAGSLHLAMIQAGIECYNIIPYTSILPGIAHEVPKPTHYIHGSVAEVIWAVATAEQGKLATAGIIYGWLHHKETKEKYGGLVCEYNGSLSEQKAGEQLRASLNELYVNGFEKDYEFGQIILHTTSIVPEKKYGTALIALVFTSHQIPILS